MQEIHERRVTLPTLAWRLSCLRVLSTLRRRHAFPQVRRDHLIVYFARGGQHSRGIKLLSLDVECTAVQAKNDKRQGEASPLDLLGVDCEKHSFCELLLAKRGPVPHSWCA